MRTLLAILVLAASPARAAEKLVVAVLYFDNNTGNKEYDVLQKGLADMLITDLSGVEQLQIVEREKLQALLDEMKLQQSKYFDPTTAQKLGKGIGAKYALTGSIAALDPELRIDVKLVEVATAKVAMADHVVGNKAKFFELEQQLVQKFIGGLNVKLALAPSAGVKDVAALLDYSKSVDAADKGDLQGASKRLAEIVKGAPDFALAKSRYVDVLKRLREAGKKRTAALTAEEQAVSDKIEKVLAETAGKKDEKSVARRMAYKELKGHFLLLRLRKIIGPPNCPGKPTNARVILIPKSLHAEALVAMKAFFANGEEFIAEFGQPKDDTDVDSEDRQAMERLGLNPYHTLQNNPWRALAGFTFTGSQWDRSGEDVMRPTLAELDPAYAAKGFALYEAGEKVVKQEREAIHLLDEHGEAFVRLRRPEEAIPRWQEILDKYPKTDRFKEIEDKIEQVLGESKRHKDLEGSMKLCDTITNSHWMLLMNRLVWLEGDAIFKRADAIVAQCPGKPHAGWMPRAVYQGVATGALDVGDCALFKKARDRVAAINEDGKNYLDTVGAPCAVP